MCCVCVMWFWRKYLKDTATKCNILILFAFWFKQTSCKMVFARQGRKFECWQTLDNESLINFKCENKKVGSQTLFYLFCVNTAKDSLTVKHSFLKICTHLKYSGFLVHEYWIIAPRRNTGSVSWEPLITFLSADEHITIYHVFLLKDTSFNRYYWFINTELDQYLNKVH